MIPGGDSVFHVEVSVPNPYHAAVYRFAVLIYAFKDDTASFMTWMDDFQVTVVAK
jgi:hypothetical protein